MRGRLPIGLATMALALAALTGSAPAGLTPDITVSDDEFNPDQETTSVATGVNWTWDLANDNDHNVVQDKKLFNSGAAVETRVDYNLDPSAGTFPYYCSEHGNPGGVGMSGEVGVAPETVPLKRGGTAFGVEWSTGSGDSGDQFDVQFKVGQGDWKDWKKNTSQDDGAFGADDKPVNLKPDKNYKIRARSEKSSNPKKRSGWSPALKVSVN